MTGGRKNEQFDIIMQAQMIVDEYEKKYFGSPNEVILKIKRGNKRKRGRWVFFAAIVILAVFLKFVF